ncbi:TrmH family RNA methyltransferase [Geojedonia litorea]|uniref:TrmH family RNA methyltransferase n=1 Tax=Geojedonia litorea TaxID=1268269 RepID=A0ABV9N7D5_9FLAO
MLTKSQVKLISSLSQKKFRNQHGLFVVEGIKGIQEFLNSNLKLHQLFATAAVFNSETTLISENELQKISNLKTPNVGLAIFEIPKPSPIDDSQLLVALDDIRDPGNLGTIIRLCDWFGVEDLVCSSATVDCYNSKVIQATMGSLARVNISYVDLKLFLKSSEAEKFGTFMNGDSVFHENLPNKGILILGNEANGISAEIEALVNRRISIPRFGHQQATESLNVATATAIFLSEFKRPSSTEK